MLRYLVWSTGLVLAFDLSVLALQAPTYAVKQVPLGGRFSGGGG